MRRVVGYCEGIFIHTTPYSAQMLQVMIKMLPVQTYSGAVTAAYSSKDGISVCGVMQGEDDTA